MNDFFKLVLSMSLSGSIVTLILFAVSPLLKKHFSKAWQYYIWLVVILRLLIPYTPEVSIVGNLFDSIESIVTEQNTSPVQTLIDSESITNTAEQIPVHNLDGQTTSLQSEERVYDYTDYIGFIWILGVFLILAAKVFQYRNFLHYIRTGSYIVKEEETSGLFQQVKNELGVKNGIPLYQSTLVESPMLIGLFKPVIVIPDSFLKLDNLSYVFKHELIHYKRFDIWYKWLVQLTICIHWFNPLIHIMSRQINNLCEFSCDEAVSGGLDKAGKIEYCGTIISAVSLGSAFKDNIISATLCEEKKNLKERLDAILKYRKKSRRAIILSKVFVVALVCVSIFLGAFSTGGYGKMLLKEPTDIGSDTPLETQAYSPNENENKEKLIIIDPGHGGADKGYAYNDSNYFEFAEKDRNLKISLLLRDMLEESGVNVVLTRQEDKQLKLEDRMELANTLNASMFVSIHFDASNDHTKQGTLALYNSSDDSQAYGITGLKAAQLIQKEIIDSLETKDAGVMAMSEKLKYNSLKMPAMIIELAFVSNASDRERITTEGFDLEASKALHDGIISALNEM